MFNGSYNSGGCSKMTEINEDNFDRLVQHPVVISSEIRKQIIGDDDKARAYERLTPFILHVMDCYTCHKEGTDKCSWIIKGEKEMRVREGEADIEIGVLPDTIEEAQKVLDGMND